MSDKSGVADADRVRDTASIPEIARGLGPSHQPNSSRTLASRAHPDQMQGDPQMQADLAADLFPVT